MKRNVKLRIGFFLGMLISIIISVLLSTLFSMHYLSHLYGLQRINARTFMNINKRIDVIDKRNKHSQLKREAIKPVSL